ncbi:RalA-binding protein 1 [Sciurus carolinensis]|uniref:RalA-binding protein 1 n=1 Tax=Sciurus carolinensis TaxID=30640 RepID=A0AA41T4Z3_SCICA|nr:RalA-binding protein 1 [Sciurus carolinensis]
MGRHRWAWGAAQAAAAAEPEVSRRQAKCDGRASPRLPHDTLQEPADAALEEEKDHGKKKGKFKKKKTEGYAAFQEDSSGDEAESPSKMKTSKGIHVFKKPGFSKKKKNLKIEKKPKEEKHKEEKHKEEKYKETKT